MVEPHLVGTITTWDGLAQKFLIKFFPLEKTTKLRDDNTTFAPFKMELLYNAWKRFKNLLRKCPSYSLPIWLQVQTFCNGFMIYYQHND